MSWIIAALLVAYACARCVGWAQGQLRWRRDRHAAQELQPPRCIDPVAPAMLARLHTDLNALCITLARREHDVRYAASTDPDILFGKVRSNRYRIALRRASGELNELLRSLGDDPELESGSSPVAIGFRGHVCWLNEQALLVASTRALEAFDVAVVRQTAQVLGAARHCARQWQAQLERLAEEPYRREADADLSCLELSA